MRGFGVSQLALRKAGTVLSGSQRRGDSLAMEIVAVLRASVAWLPAFAVRSRLVALRQKCTLRCRTGACAEMKVEDPAYLR